MRQQEILKLDSILKAYQHTILTYNSVARNDDGDRVFCTGMSYCACKFCRLFNITIG